MNYAAHYLQDADGSLLPQHGLFFQEGRFQILPFSREVARTVFINGILFPFIPPDLIDKLSLELTRSLAIGQAIDIRAFVSSMDLPTRSLEGGFTSVLALEGGDLSRLTLNNQSNWVVLSL